MKNQTFLPNDLNRLVGETDATIWARAFWETFPNGTDYETLVGWFANAIMAGWDGNERQRRRQQEPAPPFIPDPQGIEQSESPCEMCGKPQEKDADYYCQGHAEGPIPSVEEMRKLLSGEPTNASGVAGLSDEEVRNDLCLRLMKMADHIDYVKVPHTSDYAGLMREAATALRIVQAKDNK